MAKWRSKRDAERDSGSRIRPEVCVYARLDHAGEKVEARYRPWERAITTTSHLHGRGDEDRGVVYSLT